MFSELSDFSLFPKKVCDSQALCKLHPSTSKATQTEVNFPLNLHLEIYYSLIAVSYKVSCKKESVYILQKFLFKKCP